MALPVIAAVTLGQTPRDDILGEMRALVPHAEWIQSGALDDINDCELVRLSPSVGEFPLVTRMRGGRPIVVGERAIRPLVQRAVDRIASDADFVIVLSSTPLVFDSPVPVLFPDRVLSGVVASLDSGARIVVVTPAKDQIAPQEMRWRKLGFSPVVLVGSPYGGTDFRHLGEVINRAGASLVVLDSVAYSSGMKADLASMCALPALLARSLAARVAAEIANAPRGARPLPPVGPAGPLAMLRSNGAEVRQAVEHHVGASRLASQMALNYFLGRLRPGDRLPSVRALAAHLGISPTTAADWYRKLQESGVIGSRPGSGTFVATHGTGLPSDTRANAVLGALQRSLRQFRLLGLTVGDVGRLLESCASSNPPGTFSFGFVGLPELYDALVAWLGQRFGFRLPIANLTSDDAGYAQIRKRLAGDPSIGCLVGADINGSLAYRLSRDDIRRQAFPNRNRHVRDFRLHEQGRGWRGRGHDVRHGKPWRARQRCQRRRIRRVRIDDNRHGRRNGAA